MRGIFHYCQATVAYPTVPFETDFVYDELNVSFDSRQGGTYGEFKFRFCVFQRETDNPTFAVYLGVYDDGLNAFMDPRVQRVVNRWRRWPRSRDELTPERFIGWLEEEGARPHRYHVEGLAAHADPVEFTYDPVVNEDPRWDLASIRSTVSGLRANINENQSGLRVTIDTDTAPLNEAVQEAIQEATHVDDAAALLPRSSLREDFSRAIDERMDQELLYGRRDERTLSNIWGGVSATMVNRDNETVTDQTLWGLPIVTDPTVPPHQVEIRRGNRVLGTTTVPGTTPSLNMNDDMSDWSPDIDVMYAAVQQARREHFYEPDRFAIHEPPAVR